MKNKLYSLTDEHRNQLKPWAEKWIANGMATKPMDESERAICRESVIGLYSAAGLPAPKHIVFVPSPFVARFAGGFAAAIWYLRKNKKATIAATRAATLDATDAATLAATRDATDAATRVATRDATDAATRVATLVATLAATDDATDAATLAATDDATRAATLAATDDATRAATRVATRDLSKWYVLRGNPANLAAKFNIGELGLRCAINAWRLWQGGNQWSAWAAYISFFRHVAKLPIDYSKWQHWEALTEHSGPRIMHADFCIISDRPEVLKVDAQNRPHCEDGPFCRWRDGSALYSVHGVRVPAWLIERPSDITVSKIEAEDNTEVRRVMIERYGLSRYLFDSGAQEIGSDDYGTLYRKEVPSDEPIVMVKVINSTEEADGTFKDYFLRVPPNITTAHEAVAWTFGKTVGNYTPAIQT